VIESRPLRRLAIAGIRNMFEVRVKARFSAAHNLRNYIGDCERLHGHNWLVEVAVTGQRDKEGMVVDFRTLREILNRAIETLDHEYLNEVEYFKEHNTTTENIAEYLFDRVSSALPEGLKVSRVTAWESPDCCVSVYPSENGTSAHLGAHKSGLREV
jgi:6-pyruvoyltetrahydropterin/6-carboxytetrahydropterin synthase